MRRVLVAALGCALAGCAQGPAARPGTIPGLGPVGYTPIPALNQTVNGGLAFDSTALSWPGGTAPRGAEAARRVTALTPPSRKDPEAVVASASGPAAAAGTPSPSAMTAPAETTTPPAVAASTPTSPPPAPAAEAPQPAATDPAPAAEMPAPVAEPRTTPPGDQPAAPTQDPTAPTTEPTAPAPEPASPTPDPEPASPKDEPGGLPPLPDSPPTEPPSREGPTTPESPSAPDPDGLPPMPAPTPEPAGEPAPDPDGLPPMTAPTPEEKAPEPAPLPEPPAVPAEAPGQAPAPAAEAVPEVSPAAGPEAPAPPAETTIDHAKPVDGDAAAAAPIDPAVRTVAATPDDAEADRLQSAKVLPRLPERELLGQTVARVGDEEITLQELKTVYGLENAGRPISEAEKQQRIRAILDNIIERKMLVQAAKKRIKQPQAWEQINKQIDVEWKERELPRWLKRYNAANEIELKKRFADAGYSLDELHQNYQQELIARDFMFAEIGNKTKVDYREMREYYEANKARFDRPAQVTWREVVVEVKKHKSRAEARQKSARALERLRKGEDFATVARALSEGPRARQGGLWVTTPGSYAAAAVNAALDRLPVGQVSAIIEEPDSFHIVRVEERRAAGPAAFDEVQDDVEEAVRDDKRNRAVQTMLTKIRATTPISRLIDGPNDPGQAR